MSGFQDTVNTVLRAVERNRVVLTNAPEKAMTFHFWNPIFHHTRICDLCRVSRFTTAGDAN